MTISMVALLIGALLSGVAVGVLGVVTLSIKREDAQSPAGPPAPLSPDAPTALSGTVRGLLGLYIRRTPRSRSRV